MPSFDIVSKLDAHEVTNAVDQANRELDKRFDFRGANAAFERSEFVVTLRADAEFRLKQMQEILYQRLVARGIDIRCAKADDAEVNLAAARQKITLRQGIEQALAKDIDRAMIYIADDIICDAPAGRIEGAYAYRGFMTPFVGILLHSQMIAAFGDDETVDAAGPRAGEVHRAARARPHRLAGPPPRRPRRGREPARSAPPRRPREASHQVARRPQPQAPPPAQHLVTPASRRSAAAAIAFPVTLAAC